MDKQRIEDMVREVLRDITSQNGEPSNADSGSAVESKPAVGLTCTQTICDAEINLDVPDISEVVLQDTLYVENPANEEAYMELKKANPARLGVGRAGPRQNTKTLLRFRADHAASMDTVMNDVPEKTIEELGLVYVQSAAPDKAEYLMDPKKGTYFEPETVKLIKEKCKSAPQVQIIVSDGLSSSSVESNIRDVLPSLLQGLKGNGLSMGTNLFVRFGRVGISDAVSDILDAELSILFIGERPGLVTSESLSCYMTYKGYPGIPESARSVVSNIYKGGTSPTEAGAHIADLAKKMIELKASGLAMKHL